jgi:hypothetical protein
MAVRRRRRADPPPLTPAERASFDSWLRLVQPQDADEWLPELDRLLKELAKDGVDLRRLLLAIRKGCHNAKVEQRRAADLTEFRRTWQRDRDQFLGAVRCLPGELKHLYAKFPRFLDALDVAAQLPKDSAVLPDTASATLKALETLLATVQQDAVLQLKGTGRTRGNQPARAAARTRAWLTAAGVPSDLAGDLLRMFGILRRRSS